jgi:hypothetical protein
MSRRDAVSLALLVVLAIAMGFAVIEMDERGGLFSPFGMLYLLLWVVWYRAGAICTPLPKRIALEA